MVLLFVLAAPVRCRFVKTASAPNRLIISPLLGLSLGHSTCETNHVLLVGGRVTRGCSVYAQINDRQGSK